MEKILSRCEECHHAKWEGVVCKHPADTFQSYEIKQFPDFGIERLRLKEYNYYKNNYLKICENCKRIFKPRIHYIKNCSRYCAIQDIARKQRQELPSSSAFDVDPKQKIREKN